MKTRNKFKNRQIVFWIDANPVFDGTWRGINKGKVKRYSSQTKCGNHRIVVVNPGHRMPDVEITENCLYDCAGSAWHAFDHMVKDHVETVMTTHSNVRHLISCRENNFSSTDTL